MDNLKAAMGEFTSAQADELVDKMFSTAKAKENLTWFGEPEVVRDFVQNAAEVWLGYRHGSDAFDNGWGDYQNDSDYYDDSLMSDTKDDFGIEFLQNLESTKSFSKIEGFKELYELGKEAGFAGTKKEFEDALKKSEAFADHALHIVTRYDG